AWSSGRPKTSSSRRRSSSGKGCQCSLRAGPSRQKRSRNNATVRSIQAKRPACPGVFAFSARFDAMDDTQLLRYSRHILLSELGVDAQDRFGKSHALIVGIGGLGNPVAQFLAAAGVGTLTLVDADRVDLTTLQRQILFDTDAVGRPKVEAAAARIAAVNPEVSVVQLADRVGLDELAPLAAAADIVADCTDNFATRHAINRACVAAEKPLVSGAAIRFDG